MSTPVYLDYNATTPIASEVLEAMLPFLREHYGNPSSAHAPGQHAATAVKHARQQLATLLNARTEEIIFTGCATEANNLAIRGVARALQAKGRHLITSAIEHPSVAQPFKRLQEDGWDVSIVPVDEYGLVSANDVLKAMRDDTVLVSIMHANNETGSIQPIREIADICKHKGILMHTDAAQSTGKIAVDVNGLNVDLLSVAGHKLYASKGVGALYIRHGTPIQPVLVGAGHEQGLRPGTENVAAIVGLGIAAQLAADRQQETLSQLTQLRDHLHQLLNHAIPGVTLNGHPQQRLPNTLNISLPDVEGRELLALAAETVAASLGSACHEEGSTVSGVLGAMGVTPQRARGAIRLSIGHGTTEADIERAAAALFNAWNKARKTTG